MLKHRPIFNGYSLFLFCPLDRGRINLAAQQPINEYAHKFEIDIVTAPVNAWSLAHLCRSN